MGRVKKRLTPGTIAFAAMALILVMQLIRPARTNPVVQQTRSYKAHLSVTPEVARVLERSCSDCHSNHTVWPWYSNVAPLSWIVIDDVNHGRRHLNLSDWAPEDPGKLLEDICEEVSTGGMPLLSYVWTHREARLSEAERKMICAWTATERQRLVSLPAQKLNAK